MKMLRVMVSNVIEKQNLKNIIDHKQLGVALIRDAMRENMLGQHIHFIYKNNQ